MGGFREIRSCLGSCRPLERLAERDCDCRARHRRTGRLAEDAEMADVLDNLGNPDAITLARIHSVAPADFQTWLTDRKNRSRVPYRMEKCGYLQVRNENDSTGLWSINGKRQVVYVKTTLSPPARIAAVKQLVF
jgi:hypothetical protein